MKAVRKSSEPDPVNDAPLYIRWSPDRSPYSIEVRLDLVSKIDSALADAEKRGIEIGGVLIGSMPDAYTPTLRVEDVEMIPRNGSEGAAPLLPGEIESGFSGVRASIRNSGRVPVGLFRSYLRNGNLQPSLADRGMLLAEFKQSVFAVLLVEGRAPHLAALFVADKGYLPEEPAVRQFRFSEAEFRSLPEVQPDLPETDRQREKRQHQRWRIFAVIAALLVIGVGACILMWSFTNPSGLSQWFNAGHQLRLEVSGSDHLLRISWNHAARELDGASGAKLAIADGQSHREIIIGLDELRLGAVEYERNTPEVEVTMTIEKPGAAPVIETAGWTQK